MSVVRIKALALGATLLLGACSSGDKVTANDTVTATPQAGDPAALPSAVAPEKGAGIITIESHHAAPETVRRLKTLVTQNRLKLVGVVDHQATAKAAGQDLRPTSVVLFDDPTLAAPLLMADQTMGLDLPQRVLVYTDRAGQTWIAYDDPAWIAARHGVTGQDGVLQRFAGAVATIVHNAAN